MKAAADTGKIRAAALQTGDSGNVLLDVGRVSGVGSEFASLSPDSRGQSITLRVTALEGIARATAAIVSPAGARVSPGEIFEMTKWIPAEQAPLRVWNWPSNLSIADVVAASDAIAASGVEHVTDPAEEPWTHVLCWYGKNWTLQRAGATAPTLLGGKLTAEMVKRNLPAGGKLWANLPPPRELASKLDFADAVSAVQAANDLKDADYALAGSVNEKGPAYAWYHKGELVGGAPTPSAMKHSPGCSAASPYPARSDWVGLTGPASLEPDVASLRKNALLLAKVHGWLSLANGSAAPLAGDYYTLGLSPAPGAAVAQRDVPARQGDELKMMLQSTARVIEKR